MAEDDPATAIDVLANDTDVDGGPITIDSVTQPANGTVVITGGGDRPHLPAGPELLQRPSPATPRTRSPTRSTGGSTATVSVTVTCVDDPPVAVDDTATVAEDAAGDDDHVLANDTDLDGDPITIDSVTQPANGTVAITGGGAEPHLPAGPELLQHPARRAPGHVHLHADPAARPPPCR